MVGPLMAAPGKPLSAELQALLSPKGHGKLPDGMLLEEGAVYVSMGTAVRFEEDEIVSMAANLAALKHPVLWKISPDDLPGEISKALTVIHEGVPIWLSLPLTTVPRQSGLDNLHTLSVCRVHRAQACQKLEIVASTSVWEGPGSPAL